MPKCFAIIWLVLAGGLFGLVSGCAGLSPGSNATHDPPPLPSRKEIRVGQYLFISDVDLRPDHPLFRRLEGLQEQVSRELCLPPGDAVISVYIFAGKEKFDRYLQANFKNLPPRRAFFMSRHDERRGPELSVFTYWSDRIAEDLRHELTHALLHSVIRTMPLWLDEGLAEYFETPPEWKGLNYRHLAEFRNPAHPPWKSNLPRLESLTHVRDMTAADYREAWAWVHFLLRSTPENKNVLLDYLHDLRAGRNPGPLEPRLTAVCGVPETELREHLRRLDDATRVPGGLH